MTWAEDRAPVGTDPSADPGAVSEGRAARCRPPSPFAYSTNAINPSSEQQPNSANPSAHGFHFTLNQDTIASFVVCIRKFVNNVLLDLRLKRFFKGVTQ